MVQIGRIQGFTREMGKHQEQFLTVPIRDMAYLNEKNEVVDRGMQAAFLLTDEEIEKLKSGEPLILEMQGTDWIPMKMMVGDPMKEFYESQGGNNES